MKCQYRDENGVMRVRDVCSGLLDDVVIPAVTMCDEQLFFSIDATCAESTSYSSVVPSPSPTPTSTANKMLFMSSIVDFRNPSTTYALIYRVAEGKRLMIDTLEMVTLTAAYVDIGPYISFGTSSNTAEYYGPILSTSTEGGMRHIVDQPQNLVSESTNVVGRVITGSVADTGHESDYYHTGFFLMTGYLMDVS